uniref:Uncharacterized protein n=1 Tax=uncultured Nitrospirota bacterium TaxID=170969 RepID=A0A142BTT2_9BACT|nr:hypothetical protein [uncultured Nitrospirota bacterium]
MAIRVYSPVRFENIWLFPLLGGPIIRIFLPDDGEPDNVLS